MARHIPYNNPELAPVKEASLQGAAISMEALGIEALRIRFKDKKAWAPELTDESKLILSRVANEAGTGVPLKQAAVLIPLVKEGGNLKILLTQRAAHLNDHPGQISFPGGRHEKTDGTLIATALREAEEEIGLDKSFVELLGELPDYFTVTGYRVTPVVGIIHELPALTIDANEVAGIFQVPLEFLMNPANHELREIKGPDTYRTFYAMPYDEYFIWGATAGMLRNLYHFLSAE